MNPRDLETVRGLVSSLMATLSVLDQILNGEPEEAPQIAPDSIQRRPRLAYLGEDETPPAA